MFKTPTYQIIEFLEYLRKHEKSLSLENDDILREYAKEFFIYINKQKFRSKKNIGLLLKIFQNCPKVDERDLIYQMAHFSTCGRCFEFINKDSIINSCLHPFLISFQQFIEDKYPFIIDRINEMSYELYPKSSYKRWLVIIIRDIGSSLFNAFENYVLNYADYKSIEAYKDRNRYELGDNKIHGTDEIALDSRNISIERESYRLAHSLVESLNNRDDYRQFLIGQVIDQSWTIKVEFIEWLNKRYPNVELQGNIPLSQIDELAKKFISQQGLGENKRLLKDIESLFIDEKKHYIIDRIITYLINKKKKSIKYKRYKETKIHGIFLYPNCEDINLENFINSKWEPLNSLTSDYIDIYYNEDEAKRKNGFDILYGLKSLQHIEVDKLPALIIWENELSNSVAIPLREINDKQKFELMQKIVQSIREKKQVNEIEEEANTYINQKKLENKLAGKIMGDVNINNGTTGVMGGSHKSVKVVIGEISTKSVNDFNNEVILDLDRLIIEIEGMTDIEKRDQRKCLGVLEELKESVENKDDINFQDNLNKWNKVKEELKEGSIKLIGLIADTVTIGTCLKAVLGL